MKYFGILKPFNLQTLKEQERSELFVTKGVFEQRVVVTLSKDFQQVHPTPEKCLPRPHKEFSNEVYTFFCRENEHAIKGPYYSFMTEFNDQIEDLDPGVLHATIKETTKQLLKPLQLHSGRFLFEQKNKDGRGKIVNYPREEYLVMRRNALKSELAQSSLVYPFLEGRKDHIDPISDEEANLIEEIIGLETLQKIVDNLQALLPEHTTESKSTEPPIQAYNTYATESKSKRVKSSRFRQEDKKALEYLLEKVFIG